MTSLSIPPPPRVTGEVDTVLPALTQWLYDFYNAAVIQGFFLTAEGQVTSGAFNPSTLPDPASTNIAQAQQTANEAFTKAANNELDITAIKAEDDKLRASFVDAGELTISAGATSAQHTFATAEADALYKVLVTSKGFSGTPPLDSLQITQVDRLAASFTIHVNVAPGTGNSTSFMFFVLRLPAAET